MYSHGEFIRKIWVQLKIAKSRPADCHFRYHCCRRRDRPLFALAQTLLQIAKNYVFVCKKEKKWSLLLSLPTFVFVVMKCFTDHLLILFPRQLIIFAVYVSHCKNMRLQFILGKTTSIVGEGRKRHRKGAR